MRKMNTASFADLVPLVRRDLVLGVRDSHGQLTRKGSTRAQSCELHQRPLGPLTVNWLHDQDELCSED
jgi:hypothetical protein